MQTIVPVLIDYVSETRRLDSQPSSTENTFYTAIKNLIGAVLKQRLLPFEIRVNTSEAKGKARDMSDFVLGDDKMFVGVYGEVKRASVTLEDLAVSTEQNDQIGRYLAQTGVVPSLERSGLRPARLHHRLRSPEEQRRAPREARPHQDHRSWGCRLRDGAARQGRWRSPRLLAGNRRALRYGLRPARLSRSDADA
jgi:hypothetical protein